MTTYGVKKIEQLKFLMTHIGVEAMRKNVGDMDAYLRITGGLTMFGLGIVKESTPLIGLGAMKVAEGVTRFCPLLYFLGLSTKDNHFDLNFSKTFHPKMPEQEEINSE